MATAGLRQGLEQVVKSALFHWPTPIEVFTIQDFYEAVGTRVDDRRRFH